MKVLRKIIKIDEELCNGCGLCVPDCAEGSLQIVAGKARLMADKLCDGLGACLGSCPTGALTIVEREAEEFDETAVHALLGSQETPPASVQHGSGCPSARLQTFQAASPCQAANRPALQPDSALSHWPVQIRLIPPTAAFLDNCDLLVAADCTAVSYAGFHRDFLAGRVVMMGCPKFDDQQLYVDRFTEIFRTRKLRSLTILIMEVPCCHTMLQIVRKAWNQAKPDCPVRQVVISTRGEIKEETTW
ncbi:MAG: 4Fe-4S ferredoxin [Desulfobulbus sp.]|jgi:Fe-S-cluster-containing hydrogenase component 2|uniref:ATP-binding protein n=1 Tax=Desulfobulbus sp. TaxID=895 RepID=UPI00284D78D8|nr:4Fe-4S dicluster domain-containing protein [Desulfobulbus sp.]MDR2549806.1 4Fe-4S ferredoxin [Desulfobulbus sp.]